MALNKTQIGAISCCAGVVLLISIILIASSVRLVHPNNVALNFNTVSRQISERVYTDGRYFVGLGHKFILYPTTWQVIDFSPDNEDGGPPLDAGSADGQAITLEVTVFYTLNKEMIHDLYSIYTVNYQKGFVDIAKSVLKNVATTFGTSDYFTSRMSISSSMLAELQPEFQNRSAHVEQVLLRKIEFPDNIENELIDKVVAAQTIKTREYENEVRQIQADTLVIDAEAEANITEMLAEANAFGSFLRESALANGTQLVIAAQQEAYQYMQVALMLNNTELLQFVWSRKLRRAQSETLVIGFDRGQVLLDL